MRSQAQIWREKDERAVVSNAFIPAIIIRHFSADPSLIPNFRTKAYLLRLYPQKLNKKLQAVSNLT